MGILLVNTFEKQELDARIRRACSAGVHHTVDP